MSLTGPAPMSSNPLLRIGVDLVAEARARRARWPPGDNGLSVRRTHGMAIEPLPWLLDAYERHGPVFSLRIFTSRVIWMLGPEANHFVLVSGFENFRWREGAFRDLVPLLGDGLLTIDGEFHRRSRRIMLPAFHRERIAAAAATIEQEADRALGDWRDGGTVDVYEWARVLALRVAMRALFGIDADARGAASDFEQALDFYGKDYAVQALRGPGTPWRRLVRSRARLDELIFAEIARRRRTGARGEDILSMLLDARDEQDGTALSDRHVRDEVMTLLFAGHDTTTATVSFLFYELARHPEWRARLEDDPAELEMALDETLRLYPPAWVGPRRSVRAFEFAGVHVPADMPVGYCSYASHRLPDVWEEPDAFRPERFSPESRKKIPRGAYVPFGGGSRTCIGMRFGQLEIGTIARAILERFTLDLVPGYRLRVRQTPTLGPRDGLPMRITAAARRPSRPR